MKYDGYNIAIGDSALYHNNPSSPFYNVPCGTRNVGVGGKALYYYGFGQRNTAIGDSALFGPNDCDYNVGVGFLANVTSTVACLHYSTSVGAKSLCNGLNSIALGYGVFTNGTNIASIGNASVGWVGTLGISLWQTGSDARIKNNVKEDVPGLSFITQLRPVTYNIDVDKENEILGIKDISDYPEKYDVEKKVLSGFIAQEVEAAAKKIGYEFNGISKPKNEKGIYSLSYASFVMPLVKAVQELNDKNIEQQKTIEALMLLNTKIEDKNKNFESSISKLQEENKLLNSKLEELIKSLGAK